MRKTFGNKEGKDTPDDLDMVKPMRVIDKSKDDDNDLAGFYELEEDTVIKPPKTHDRSTKAKPKRGKVYNA